MLSCPAPVGPFVGDALQRVFLGLEVQPFLEIAAVHCRPARVLAVGRGNPWAFQKVFPHANVRQGALLDPLAAELVVLHLALRDRHLDLPDRVERLWRELPEGAHLLVVDLHRVRFEGLRRNVEVSLDLDLGPPLLETLRRHIVPLHVAVHQHLGGMWSTFAFVGRKGCPVR